MLKKILSAATIAALSATLLTGCPVSGPENDRPPKAEQWYRNAQTAFTSADFTEAQDAVGRALSIVPEDVQVKTLAAQIALTSLDYDETLKLVKGVTSSEAAGLRGRALWYKGELDAAADELDAMLNDPDVKDEWAKSTSKLARRGAGRNPFVTSGALLASVEMVHVNAISPYFVVPLEIDGESALALIATGTAEVVLDSATRPEPSWVSLRFGGKLEVKDVPALAQDLAGVSKEVGAPIKALLGVNILRKLNATLDYGGHQFVLRTFSPPPPPNATRMELRYVRGGGLVVRAAIGGEQGPKAAMLVDTSRPFPLALDQAGWKKAGVELTDLKPLEGDPEGKLKQGIVKMLRLGAFDIARVGGLYGVPFADIEKMMQVDLDGVLGAGLLYAFRCTFTDSGRTMWVEDDNAVRKILEGNRGPINEAPPPPPPPKPAEKPADKPAPK